ncbi:MAG: family 20 glycosylhydrolase [Lentisphaerae bacterium]|nr:family 20 glycosylhydrolase [Lentisphaerota bacterium]
MNPFFLPGVREYRQRASQTPMPATVIFDRLPERLDGTLPVDDLRQWKQTGKGALTVSFHPCPVKTFCRAPLRPFQRREAYRLSVTDGRVRVEYETEEGAFRALTTLAQFLQLHADLRRPTLAAAVMTDYPALEYRGLMYDFARNQVHRQTHVLEVIRLAIRFKTNHMQLYLEDHFQFPSLPAYPGNRHYLSPGQAHELDAFARKNFLTLIPQTNCLGHNEGALGREIFNDLMEDRFRGAQVCPSNPATLRHLDLRLRDLASVFSSPLLHIGGDEAWELGYCSACRAFAKRHGGGDRGKGELYLKHLLAVRAIAARHGRRIAVWGDMIKNHPGIRRRVPRDVVIYDWIYGNSDYASLKTFRDLGFTVIAAASSSSYESVGMNLPRCADNIQSLFHDANRLNIRGGEMTVWEMEHGTFFHSSLFAVAYAAHFLWSGRRLPFDNMARRLSVNYFGLDAPVFGRLTKTLFDEIQAHFRKGLLSAAREAPVPTLGYGGWDNLMRLRKAIFWWTSDIPEKQSPFYHLIGLLTTPSYDPEYFERGQKGVRRAQADIAELRRRAKRRADILLVYDMTCRMYDFTVWMTERIRALEKDYHRGALAQARGDRGWHRHLKGLTDFLTEIERRYRELRALQRIASTRYGHPEADIRQLDIHLSLTRRFRDKLLRLKQSRDPLPSYHRFLLEYPLRHW